MQSGLHAGDLIVTGKKVPHEWQGGSASRKARIICSLCPFPGICPPSAFRPEDHTRKPDSTFALSHFGVLGQIRWELSRSLAYHKRAVHNSKTHWYSASKACQAGRSVREGGVVDSVASPGDADIKRYTSSLHFVPRLKPAASACWTRLKLRP
jgi:hypothetical protein